MNNCRFNSRAIALAFCAAILGVSQAFAWPIAKPQSNGFVHTIAADCYSIGQQVAAQKGGTLAKASEAQRGGKAVCVIVVLVPGKEGQRPRRTEVVVPLG